MKYIKIAVAILVIGVVVFLIWKWIGDPVKKGSDIPKAENQYVQNINAEIDSLRQMPNDVFCNKLYNNIDAHIKAWHGEHRLGEGDDNETWAKILQKNLNAAYCEKLINKANHTFRQSEWKPTDISLIQREVKKMQGYPDMEPNSQTAKDLKDIIDIVNKYDEVKKFIKDCKECPFPDFEIKSEFDQNDKIRKSKEYLSTNIDGTKVNNCTQLREELEKCPQYLYERHKRYLKEKIEKLYVEKQEYKKFSEQSKYNIEMYQPISNQVEALNDNRNYAIDDDKLRKDYKKLKKILTDQDQEAYNNHFKYKQ